MLPHLNTERAEKKRDKAVQPAAASQYGMPCGRCPAPGYGAGAADAAGVAVAEDELCAAE